MPSTRRGSCILTLAVGIAFVLSPKDGVAQIDHRPANDKGASDSRIGKPPYNILFLICDQESYHLRAGEGYVLPARQAIRRRGVTFKKHYIGAAVCTPSRALFFTGLPPQVNGVYDHLVYGYVPSLDPKIPNMGSVLKGLGYTAPWHLQ